MFILTFLLMALNFRALMVPAWFLAILTICLSVFQMISILGYGFWTVKLWKTWTKDNRLIKILYFVLLILVTVLTADLTRRMVLRNG